HLVRAELAACVETGQASRRAVALCQRVLLDHAGRCTGGALTGWRLTGDASTGRRTAVCSWTVRCPDVVVVVDHDAVGARTAARLITSWVVPDKATAPDAAGERERLGIEEVDRVVRAVREDVFADIVLDEADVEAGGCRRWPNRGVERHRGPSRPH